MFFICLDRQLILTFYPRYYSSKLSGYDLFYVGDAEGAPVLPWPVIVRESSRQFKLKSMEPVSRQRWLKSHHVKDFAKEFAKNGSRACVLQEMHMGQIIQQKWFASDGTWHSASQRSPCNLRRPLLLSCIKPNMHACGDNVVQHERGKPRKSSLVCVREIKTFIVQSHLLFQERRIEKQANVFH